MRDLDELSGALAQGLALQLGNAVLGHHIVHIVEAGVITNAKKNIHKGKSVATFLMGTRRLYDYVDNNPEVAMMPVDYVNDPRVICQNDNLVSINSCVQVDLMGQVVSCLLYTSTSPRDS